MWTSKMGSLIWLSMHQTLQGKLPKSREKEESWSQGAWVKEDSSQHHACAGRKEIFAEQHHHISPACIPLQIPKPRQNIPGQCKRWRRFKDTGHMLKNTGQKFEDWEHKFENLGDTWRSLRDWTERGRTRRQHFILLHPVIIMTVLVLSGLDWAHHQICLILYQKIVLCLTLISCMDGPHIVASQYQSLSFWRPWTIVQTPSRSQWLWTQHHPQISLVRTPLPDFKKLTLQPSVDNLSTKNLINALSLEEIKPKASPKSSFLCTSSRTSRITSPLSTSGAI